MATHATVWSGILATANTTLSVGYAVVRDTSGYFRPATTANRTTYGRARGIAITAASTAVPSFEYQVAGVLSESVSGVGTGTAGDWVRVTAAGALERTASISSGNDVIGRCPTTTAEVQVLPGFFDDDNYAGGASFTAPTGTGVVTVTSGALDAASTGTTGTGSYARATSPTFVTPVIGAATGTSVVLTSYWSTGATPATEGAGRLSSNTFIFSRNSTNNDNVSLIGLNGSDDLIIGDGGYNLTLTTGTARTLELQSDTHTVASGNGVTDFLSITSSAVDVKLSATQATGNARAKAYGAIANVQTTDATVTSVYTWTITDEAVTMVTGEVCAVKSDGTTTASYVRRARIKRDGGTVTVGSVVDVATDEDSLNGDVTIDNSTETGRVRVTGIGATTIDWGAVVTRLEVTHA
jgi:hypothetical protein